MGTVINGKHLECSLGTQGLYPTCEVLHIFLPTICKSASAGRAVGTSQDRHNSSVSHRGGWIEGEDRQALSLCSCSCIRCATHGIAACTLKHPSPITSVPLNLHLLKKVFSSAFTWEMSKSLVPWKPCCSFFKLSYALLLLCCHDLPWGASIRRCRHNWNTKKIVKEPACLWACSGRSYWAFLIGTGQWIPIPHNFLVQLQFSLYQAMFTPNVYLTNNSKVIAC